MSSVTNVSNVPNNAAASFLNPETTIRDTGKQTLNVDDFLKLITVQLQSQDPLKPMEDTQFISQMASFTSLEQMQTLSKDFETFSADQKAASAQDFLGKNITVTTPTGNVTGTVTTVSYDTGVPTLWVNGKEYNLGDIISVGAVPPPPPSSSQSSSTTNTSTDADSTATN